MLHTQLTPGIASLALRSPLLAPLSPPPVDAEVQALEAEVTEASLRVAELRTSMQAKLQEQLAAKLAACRPAADLEPQQQQAVADGEGTAAAQPGGQPAAHEVAQQGADGVAPPAEEQQVQPMDAEPAAVQMSPRPDELQQRLLQAANRMPALRARLEQATDRLQRVVAAVAADIARPPPNTVEKAMLGKTPGRPATAAAGAGADAAGAEENVPGVSPLFKQVGSGGRQGHGAAGTVRVACRNGSLSCDARTHAWRCLCPLAQALESGQISTRRRVGRDVQPVPYSQPE